MGIRHERCRMSTTVGPSRTFQSRRRMSAFGGKADIANRTDTARSRQNYDFDDKTDSSWRRTLDRWKVRAYVRQRSANSGHSASFDRGLFISQC